MKCFKCKKAITLNSSAIYGLHLECFKEWFDLKDVNSFKNVIMKPVKKKQENLKFSKFNSSFFQGKFRKYSVELNEELYILKVQEKEYLELPFVEFLSNEIAKKLKINIPKFYLINFEGKITFVSKVFIKKYKTNNLVHIYHYLKKNSEYNCETIMNIILDVTGREVELNRFIELCLYDALIGNNDRHGRNLGFLETSKNKKLAPFYDNTSYIGIEIPEILKADLSPRGKIATFKTNEPTMKDYVKEFKRLGKLNIVIGFYKKIKEKELMNLVNDSFLSKPRQNAFKVLLEKNYLELKNEL